MTTSGPPTHAARIVRVIDGILVAFAVLAGVMLAVQALSVAADALMRQAGSPIRWVHEVTTYLLIAEGMLAAPYALRRGAHFRVTILVDRFSALRQRQLEIVLYTIAAIGFTVFAIYSAQTALSTLENGLRAPTLLRTPLVIPQAMLPLGAGLLVLACIAQVLAPTQPVDDADAGTDPGSVIG